MPSAIFYAVSDTVLNPGRSGIQSVVRSLAAALGARAGANNNDHARPAVHPVLWNTRHEYFQPLPPQLSLGLGAEPLRPSSHIPWQNWLTQPILWPFSVSAWLRNRRVPNFPLSKHPSFRRDLPGGWLLLPELAYSGRAELFLASARRLGLRVAAIFHDAIPLTHPEFCPPELPSLHAAYMRTLARADLILPNSEESAAGWHRFITDEKLPTPAVRVCTLASEIFGADRVRDSADKPPISTPPTLRILTVSTLEPRKNHAALLDAFSLAVTNLAASGGPRLELHLVGAPYVGARHIMTRVHRAMREHPNAVFWHEKVEHSRLRQLYRECDFTVYPSVVEGFGLPVIESLWFGRPCVCANFGVMAENAAGGGCLTADVRDPRALADAILALARSPELRTQLTASAVARPLKTWDDYAQEIVGEIQRHSAQPRG